MANKAIGDLKKGDKFKAPASDGKKVYLTWCTVTRLDDVTIHDPNGVKQAGSMRKELKAIEFKAESGALKGTQFGPIYLDVRDLVIIPDRPNKFWRIMKELTS